MLNAAEHAQSSVTHASDSCFCRLRQEQGISQALLKRQHQLRAQLEKVKQAILVLSE